LAISGSLPASRARLAAIVGYVERVNPDQAAALKVLYGL
jgi:hypothetical protein